MNWIIVARETHSPITIRKHTQYDTKILKAVKAFSQIKGMEFSGCSGPPSKPKGSFLKAWDASFSTQNEDVHAHSGLGSWGGVLCPSSSPPRKLRFV